MPVRVRDERRNSWEPVVVVTLCSVWIGREEGDSTAASENGEDRGLEVGKNEAVQRKNEACDMLRVLR